VQPLWNVKAISVEKEATWLDLSSGLDVKGTRPRGDYGWVAASRKRTRIRRQSVCFSPAIARSIQSGSHLRARQRAGRVPCRSNPRKSKQTALSHWKSRKSTATSPLASGVRIRARQRVAPAWLACRRHRDINPWIGQSIAPPLTVPRARRSMAHWPPRQHPGAP
jgi:hypothetical protein